MKNKKSSKLNERLSNDNTKNYRLLIYAFIVGIIVGVMGALFRLVLEHIEDFRMSLYGGQFFAGKYKWILSILFAIIGVFVALFLVRKYAPETSGSGVQEIEGALDEVRPMRWRRVLPVKFFASLFSLGSGLLLGREGPTIQLGANLGRMVKDVFKQPETENNPLVSAGAAAGLASAFNAPFAGIVFVIEEMHGHFKFNFFSVAAVMIGSGTADYMVRILFGSKAVIQMNVLSSPDPSVIWLFIILGLVFSIIGYIYNKLLILSLNIFKKTSKMPIIYPAVFVGLIIAVTGIFFPEMIGGGYVTIGAVLENSYAFYFLVILFFIRFILSIFSYSSGVPGGIFAPLLTLGVILGMLYGSAIQHFSPGLVPHSAVFAVAGMAGIFAATVRAPLTGLVLAVEMTSNFELILPLIATTVTASVFTALLGNEPIYTTLLERTLANEKKSKYKKR